MSAGEPPTVPAPAEEFCESGGGSDDELDEDRGEPPADLLRSLIRDALLKADGDADGAHVVENGSSTPTLRTTHQHSDVSSDGEGSVRSWTDYSVDDGTRMKLLTADLVGEDIDLRPEERKAIYSAILGRCPAALQTVEDRIDELEREIWKLPQEQKGPILRVLQKNPMLFTVSTQARLFLYSEDFDAKRAAWRMANYWARREQLYNAIGEESYREGDVRGANLDDYIRFYIRSEQILEDPEVDDVSREIAGQFIRCVRKSKVTAMNKHVAQAVKGREDLASFLEECGYVPDIRSETPHIAGSDDFKMAFVRSEDFNEMMAAGRLMQYWSMKYELFGTRLASKDITLDDMEDCSNVMELGFIRLMPGVDKYGRVVVVFNMKALTDALDESMGKEMHDGILKTIWYVLIAASEQKECQKKGLVFLANLRGGNAGLLRQFEIRAAARRILLRCMPLKVKAFHFFFPPSESWWQSMIYALFKYAEPLYKKHAVIHAGSSQEEELSELAEYGLMSDGLPTELGGHVDFDSHAKWLEERRTKEPRSMA